MSKISSSERTLLPETDEQVMIRPNGSDKEYGLIGTITRRTVHGIECVVDAVELESQIPAAIDKRSGIASLIPPAKKAEIEVIYSREGRGVHKFTTHAVAKGSGAEATLHMEIPASVRKSQRRKDYRLPLAAKVLLTSPGSGLKTEAGMVNLSATGAMLICPVAIKNGQVITLTLLGEAAEDIDMILAVVVECSESTPDQAVYKTSHTLRLAFNDGFKTKLLPAQRERIAHYIFDQQREMLRLRALMGR